MLNILQAQQWWSQTVLYTFFFFNLDWDETQIDGKLSLGQN